MVSNLAFPAEPVGLARSKSTVGPNPKKAVLKPVSGRELEESPKAFIYVWLGQRSTLVEWLRLKRALGPDIVILLEF